jgi:thioredoxin 1
MVAEVGRRHAGRLAVGALDVDAHPGAAARYDVLSLPTVILFSAGEPVARLTGRITPDRLEAAVAPRLASTDRRIA